MIGERDQVIAERDQLTDERELLSAELDRVRVALEREREQHADARNRVTTLTEQRDQLKTEVGEANAAAKDAVSAQVQAEKQAAVLAAKLEAEQTKTADLADRLTTEKAEARQAIAERQAALDAANGELKEALKQVTKLEHELGEQLRLVEAKRAENQRLLGENRTLEAEILRLQEQQEQTDKKGK